MKLSGSCVLPGPPDAVWDLLTDPARLAKCLPGCEKLESAGADRYVLKAKFAVAAIGGSFSGAVTLTETVPPRFLKMRIEGRGTVGHMTGEGRVTLAARGAETEVRYDGSAQVGGLIAGVGQRMIEAAARRIVAQFFESAARLMTADRET